MNKREKFNKKAMKRYRRRVLTKKIVTFGACMTAIVGALLILAEPVKDFDFEFFAIKLIAFVTMILSSIILILLEHYEIKKPVITERKTPTDYSKDFAELQLRYEVIEEPKK